MYFEKRESFSANEKYLQYKIFYSTISLPAIQSARSSKSVIIHFYRKKISLKNFVTFEDIIPLTV